MKITMKLCPDLNKLDSVTPVVVETKENGIEIFAKDEMFRNIVKKDYLLLGSSFEERVQKLKECKEKGDTGFYRNEKTYGYFDKTMLQLFNVIGGER